MAGLAQVLMQRRVAVTGSQPAPGPAVERLRRLGVRVYVHAGLPARTCPTSTRLFVHDPEISRTHPARLSARRRGLDSCTPIQYLGEMLRQGVGLVVAGGRAASVASAMVGWTLTRAGLDPTFVLGTAVPQLGGWARLGQGPHVVVEAAGGRTSGEGWDTLAPRLAVLLDGEDGGDGPGVEALRALAGSIAGDGRVLALAGCPRAEAALRGQGGNVEWLGLERGADWWGTDLREDQGRFRFRTFRRGQFVLEVRLQVPGRRNVLGALAAVAACDALGVPAREIQQGLEEFGGVSRDFESRGSYRGVTLIDDEDDQPEAVGQTLRLGRSVFGDRRIWAVLAGPGTVLATEVRDRYIAALSLADEVLITERAPGAGPARGKWVRRGEDDATDRIPPSDAARIEHFGAIGPLAEALAMAGKRARSVGSLDDAILELDRHLEPGDVLVTLGAGDVGTISDAFIRRLPRDRPGR
jgi:UDP-N-acetylmuramate--alanine ligase